jgi:hypothetical protein
MVYMTDEVGRVSKVENEEWYWDTNYRSWRTLGSHLKAVGRRR